MTQIENPNKSKILLTTGPDGAVHLDAKFDAKPISTPEGLCALQLHVYGLTDILHRAEDEDDRRKREAAAKKAGLKTSEGKS